ncbi:MAG: 5-formyltetrahydrofolate cyclo-ligase [Candidatus Omnitrophica bacterium]|nr:5-formyltetrahydrofolate cyclo-ligase [Candidatus Omnitrophota bacterium]
MNINKNVIRKEIINLLRNLDRSLRAGKSLIIQKKLIETEVFKRARFVMSYVSILEEVSTDYLNAKILESGKKLAVPYIDINKKEMHASLIDSLVGLSQGPLGTKVPKDGSDNIVCLKEIDLIVVPAVAYDIKNNRLGRGGGYYDAFLSNVNSPTTTVGLAFKCQVLDSLPVEEHDIPVKMVISD